MTRKHFEVIAGEINEAISAASDKTSTAIIETLAYRLGLEFYQFNSNFNLSRFLEACGVSDNPGRYYRI